MIRAPRCMACMGTALLFKWRVHQQVDGGYCFVAGYETLAKVAQEVVVGCLRPRRDEMTASLGKSVLHLETRECTENFSDIRRRDRLEAKPSIVERNAHRAHGHLRLFVKRD